MEAKDKRERCEGCRFIEIEKTHWREGKKSYERPANEWTRRCHRFPPILTRRSSSCASWWQDDFPSVKADDWCGEYQEPTP